MTGKVNHELKNKVKGDYSSVNGVDLWSVNKILEIFVDASNFRTWEEFIKNQIGLQEQAEVIEQKRVEPIVQEEETIDSAGKLGKFKLQFFLSYWKKIWGNENSLGQK